MSAYEDMVRGTATDVAPWYVMPADRKWFAHLLVATAIVERLEAIDPKFPKLDEDEQRNLAMLRRSASDVSNVATQCKKRSKRCEPWPQLCLNQTVRVWRIGLLVAIIGLLVAV